MGMSDYCVHEVFAGEVGGCSQCRDDRVRSETRARMREEEKPEMKLYIISRYMKTSKTVSHLDFIPIVNNLDTVKRMFDREVSTIKGSGNNWRPWKVEAFEATVENDGCVLLGIPKEILYTESGGSEDVIKKKN